MILKAKINVGLLGYSYIERSWHSCKKVCLMTLYLPIKRVENRSDTNLTLPWRFQALEIISALFIYSFSSDVLIDFFHDSQFTWIHRNSCRFDSIQVIYDKLPIGIRLAIHKCGEQHRRFNSQFN